MHLMLKTRLKMNKYCDLAKRKLQQLVLAGGLKDEAVVLVTKRTALEPSWPSRINLIQMSEVGMQKSSRVCVQGQWATVH